MSLPDYQDNDFEDDFDDNLDVDSDDDDSLHGH